MAIPPPPDPGADPYGNPSAPPWQGPGYGPPPQGYFAPPPTFPPPPYGAMPYGYGVVGYGPPGRIRGTGVSILLFVVTFGIYGYVYNYQVHSEMKAHSGRGIGGGIALLLTFLANLAMPFVTPAEVGSLYARRGEREPVNGWTGLWFLVPAVSSYITFFILLLSTVGTASTDANGDTHLSTAAGVTLGVGIAALVIIIIAAGIVWFVKTNNALNRYWTSIGVV